MSYFKTPSEVYRKKLLKLLKKKTITKKSVIEAISKLGGSDLDFLLESSYSIKDPLNEKESITKYVFYHKFIQGFTDVLAFPNYSKDEKTNTEQFKGIDLLIDDLKDENLTYELYIYGMLLRCEDYEEFMFLDYFVEKLIENKLDKYIYCFLSAYFKNPREYNGIHQEIDLFRANTYGSVENTSEANRKVIILPIIDYVVETNNVSIALLILSNYIEFLSYKSRIQLFDIISDIDFNLMSEENENLWFNNYRIILSRFQNTTSYAVDMSLIKELLKCENIIFIRELINKAIIKNNIELLKAIYSLYETELYEHEKTRINSMINEENACLKLTNN